MYELKMSAGPLPGRPSVIWSKTLTNPRAKTCDTNHQHEDGKNMVSTLWGLQAQLAAVRKLKHSMCNSQIHLIILVGVVPSQQMLLYKQFLNDCVVDGWNRLLKIFIEGLFCIRHGRWTPCCTVPGHCQLNVSQRLGTAGSMHVLQLTFCSSAVYTTS